MKLPEEPTSVEELSKLLRQRPNDLKLHIKLATAYHEAGRTDEAIRRLSTIADHLARKGHYKAALAVNDSLLKLAPWQQEAVARGEMLTSKINLPKEIMGHPARRTLLAGIPSDKLPQVANLLRVERFPAQTPIIREGEAGDKLYIVRSGSANVYLSDREHKNHRLTTLQEGDFFGEIAILTGSAHMATVLAKENTELWVLGHEDCHRLMRAYPAIKEVLYRTSDTRIRETAKLVKTKGIERRAFPRVRTNMPGHIEFKPPGANASGKCSVPVRIMDISASGAGLMLSRLPDSARTQCAKETPVLLSFILEGGQKTSAQANVEWVSQDERGQCESLGVSFTNMGTAAQEGINKYVTRALLSQT